MPELPEVELLVVELLPKLIKLPPIISTCKLLVSGFVLYIGVNELDLIATVFNLFNVYNYFNVLHLYK